MKKSFKYALAIGIIKKVVLLIFLFSNYSFSQVQIQGAQPTYANPNPQPIKVQIQQNQADAGANAFNAARNATSNSLKNASIRKANYAAKQAAEAEARAYNAMARALNSDRKVSLADNFTKVKVDRLKGNMENYKYVTITNVRGWRVTSNYETIAQKILSAKKLTFLNYKYDIKGAKKLEINRKKSFAVAVPSKFKDDSQLLLVEWTREALQSDRLSTLQIKNTKGEILYLAKYKNIGYDEMLKPLTSNYNFSKEEAKAKIMEFKEYLDLGIISQEEFESKISEYKKILLGN